MRKHLATVAFLFAVTGCLAQPAPGVYKVVSFDIEVDGAPTVGYFGKSPQGYIVLTKSHFMSVLTAEGRRPGRSSDEKAAQLDSLIAYAGPYRIEGDKLIVDVQSAWVEAWKGTKQSRTWKIDGNRLTLTTERAPYSRDPSKMATATLSFEKVE